MLEDALMRIFFAFDFDLPSFLYVFQVEINPNKFIKFLG